ncbi:MAG: MiaB/RimO family radical SAM methylthiotransferase, partial [Deltaproteobacteria bacterium]|nr:MiaB/RimO family radical SAM methylthiotransferase [Deltaproteobacteria bacterium]
DVALDQELPCLTQAQPGPVAVRSQVTVIQGCDNFCAYCVVPFVRGRERSRPPQDVLEECRIKVAGGAREINLLGQNVNSYRFGGWNFVRLLKAVAQTPGLLRLRFTTSHPKDMSPELIACFGEVDRLCPSLHLPFQAGSDKILKLMNRGYSRADYLDLVKRLRAVRPDVALSADCIVGFPGETEADFRQTMDLIEEVRFEGLFSFCYSDRPLTKARLLKNKVPPQAAAERLKKLQARQKEITFESNLALEGRRVMVLVEGPAKRGRLLTGRTGGNKVVNFKGGPELVGRIEEVIIERAGTNSLQGEPVRG